MSKMHSIFEHAQKSERFLTSKEHDLLLNYTYYNHFIKKKLKGMMELFDIREKAYVSKKEMIMKDRLRKAISLIKKYSRKHKNMKMLITGSFLYKGRYNDIDIFVISKYDKEDYKEGKVHINYLPADIENTLFFKSISLISVSNFVLDRSPLKEGFKLADILHLYEAVTLLMMQKDGYLTELRELVLRAEYISNKVILDSMQLREITDNIRRSNNPIKVLSKYIAIKIINSYRLSELKRVLNRFIEKNSKPEKGKEIYPNWKVYNQTYKEVLEVAA